MMRCQSASNFDPLGRRDLAVALAPDEAEVDSPPAGAYTGKGVSAQCPAFWQRQLMDLTLLLPAAAGHQAGEVARKTQ